jgi:hypothetical protein
VPGGLALARYDEQLNLGGCHAEQLMCFVVLQAFGGFEILTQAGMCRYLMESTANSERTSISEAEIQDIVLKVCTVYM